MLLPCRELLNEPRVLTSYTGGGGDYERSRGGLQPGVMLCEWVHEMAAYVK